MNARRRTSRTGFTLVEMLVVIAIIAILAGLITVAAFSALGQSRVTVRALEMTQIEQALEAYNDTNKGYPPCIGGNSASSDLRYQAAANTFAKHMMRAYRNGPALAAYTGNPGVVNGTNPELIYNPMSAYHPLRGKPEFRPGVRPDSHEFVRMWSMDAAEGYVFFLGGGLRKNPTTPIASAAGGDPLSFFAFNPTRLVDLDDDGLLEYVPQYTDRSTPYVYFTSDIYGFSPASASGSATADLARWPLSGSLLATDGSFLALSTGVVRPMLNQRSDVTTTPPSLVFEGSNKYQFFCPGSDGLYYALENINSNGEPDIEPGAWLNYHFYPTGLNWSGMPAVRDNQASFADNNELQAILP